MDPELRYPPKRASGKRRAHIDEDGDYDAPQRPQTPPRSSKKRKSNPEVIDLTGDSPSPQRAPPKKRGKRDTDAPVEEKRTRVFRKRATESYLAVRERAFTQRLTVLSRERCGSDTVPEEKVIIAGSTGNVYTVSIGLVPSCDCPHARKGNQCKHIVYVILRVLKARENIAYQLALLSSELREVIKNAPPIPGVETDGKDGTEKAGEDGNRKSIEGECPICYDELGSKEDTVYCKASCGNNIHKACMQNWMAASSGKGTCPYCRAKWEADTGLEGNLGDLVTKGLRRNEDGYVNVAGQLGLSGHRDYSTYHQPWVRQRGYGGLRRGGYDYDNYY
ncbi:RING finger domain containing protein [Pyrenophora tritici-repentis]|nr:RING finger domain containing protein [Pyrenophora tritici-repentis]